MQVRVEGVPSTYHMKSAASSLDADCRNPQHPPAFLDPTITTLFPWNFGGPTHTIPLCGFLITNNHKRKNMRRWSFLMKLHAIVSGPGNVVHNNALLKLGAEPRDGGGLTDVFHMPCAAVVPSSPSQTEWRPLLAASLLLLLDATNCRIAHPTWQLRVSMICCKSDAIYSSKKHCSFSVSTFISSFMYFFTGVHIIYRCGQSISIHIQY